MIDVEVINILDSIKGAKGSEYLSSMSSRIGKERFEILVRDLNSQLRGVPDIAAHSWEKTVEILSNLEGIIDKVVYERDTIERGTAWINTHFALEVALLRFYSDKMPKELKLDKSKYTAKLGMDPTNAKLHLGHTVTINKFLDFIKLGYNSGFLLGDFTATIGDPSGRSKARTALSSEQVAMYTKEFEKQLSTLLPEGVKIHYNHEWLANMSLKEFLQKTGGLNIQVLKDRPDFLRREREGELITKIEYEYPTLQALDSLE